MLSIRNFIGVWSTGSRLPVLFPNSPNSDLEQKATKGTKSPWSSRTFVPFVAFCSIGLGLAFESGPEPCWETSELKVTVGDAS